MRRSTGDSKDKLNAQLVKYQISDFIAITRNR